MRARSCAESQAEGLEQWLFRVIGRLRKGSCFTLLGGNGQVGQLTELNDLVYGESWRITHYDEQVGGLHCKLHREVMAEAIGAVEQVLESVVWR